MDTKEIILDVKNLNTTFISDRKEIRIVKNVSFQLKRGSAALRWRLWVSPAAARA